jgi:hypothetical protein
MLVVRDDGEDRLLFNDDDNVGVGLPTKKLFLLCLCGLLPVDVAPALLGSTLGRRRVALDAFIVLNSVLLGRCRTSLSYGEYVNMS